MKNKDFKANLWAYFILTARILLAWTFLGYGYSKLTASQFGVSEAEMATPLNELSLFKVSWYLFDQEPFKSFIGISQIICGLLLLFNRTVLIGAFLFLPIIITILVIDITFMPPLLAYGFAWRLSFYILLDLLIIWSYKDKIIVIWNTIWKKVSNQQKFPFWTYLLLPICVIGLEIVGAIPRFLTNLFLHPNDTIEGFNLLIKQLVEEIPKIE